MYSKIQTIYEPLIVRSGQGGIGLSEETATSSPSSIIFHLSHARQQTAKILQNYLALVPYWHKPLLKEPNMSKSHKNKNLLCNKYYIWRRTEWQNKFVGESLKIWTICCLFLYLLVFMLETCSFTFNDIPLTWFLNIDISIENIFSCYSKIYVSH